MDLISSLSRSFEGGLHQAALQRSNVWIFLHTLVSHQGDLIDVFQQWWTNEEWVSLSLSLWSSLMIKFEDYTLDPGNLKMMHASLAWKPTVLHTQICAEALISSVPCSRGTRTSGCDDVFDIWKLRNGGWTCLPCLFEAEEAPWMCSETTLHLPDHFTWEAVFSACVRK